MEYNDLTFKKPLQSEDYYENSKYVTETICNIMLDAINNNKNKIIINTNLKKGLPMENINKIAGPFVESWAQEIFNDILEDADNIYKLVGVQECKRLSMSDIILQFKKEKKTSRIIANVDVKATAEDIPDSGKSPNITSFERIRNAYIDDPDYLFIILSLKHKVYSTKDNITKLMNGIMEIVKYNVYDLKLISENDISYNPALGTGQIQIKDIHYVDIIEERTAWDFCEILDKKFISSKKGFSEWLRLATENDWIKDEDKIKEFVNSNNLLKSKEWKLLFKRKEWI